jgi:hypothetical protein
MVKRRAQQHASDTATCTVVHKVAHSSLAQRIRYTGTTQQEATINGLLQVFMWTVAGEEGERARTFQTLSSKK